MPRSQTQTRSREQRQRRNARAAGWTGGTPLHVEERTCRVCGVIGHLAHSCPGFDSDLEPDSLCQPPIGEVPTAVAREAVALLSGTPAAPATASGSRPASETMLVLAAEISASGSQSATADWSDHWSIAAQHAFPGGHHDVESSLLTQTSSRALLNNKLSEWLR